MIGLIGSRTPLSIEMMQFGNSAAKLREIPQLNCQIARILAGRALEQLVFLELRGYLDYNRLDHKLSYWRSRSQFEVDFVVGDEIGVEVKSKSRVSPRDYKGLHALGEEVRLKRKIVVCREKMRRRTDDGAEIMSPCFSLKSFGAAR